MLTHATWCNGQHDGLMTRRCLFDSGCRLVPTDDVSAVCLLVARAPTDADALV